MKLRSTFLIFTLAFPASLVLGHDDVIGTRFVAASGHDTGNCDDNHHPCRTLEYALSRVNPGDAVKLAAGTYDLSSVDIERLLIGKEGVRGKIDWWVKSMEVHRFTASEPFAAHDRFVVQYDADVTDRESKQRQQMSEVGVYTVKDGKIVREEFLPRV